MGLSHFIRRDLWERARRNPEYLLLCGKSLFDQEGYMDLEAARPGGERSLRLFRCLRRLGLTVLVRPNKDFNEINPSCFVAPIGVPDRPAPESRDGVAEAALLARMESYEVWDQRAGRKSLREIADLKRQAAQEKLGSALSKVKEHFYRAFGLIMGYPIEPETLRSLRARLGQAGTPCGDCRDEECRLAMKEEVNCFPCADYLKAIYEADFL
jgi:hypothetical protein